MKQVRSSIALLCVFLGITTALVVVVNLARADGFSLTIDTVGQGQVTANPLPPYVQDQVVSLTAVPDTGWEFVSWSEEGGAGNWWDSQWDYRVPITVSANGFQRKNKPAEVEINFNNLITSLGKVGTLDPNSIRVVEVDANGNVIDDDVAFQYDVKRTLNVQYNPNTFPGTSCSTAVPGTGTVTLIMKGTTGASADRQYHIYFDVPAKGIPAKNVTPQITFTDDVVDPPAPDLGRQASFKVETQAGTYFYHKKGAGFSSLNDANGNDWINYNGTPGSGFAGEFRGIPNLVLPNNGGLFHPGTKDNKLNTCLLSTGPLKTTIYSIFRFNANDRWMVTWEIYPTYANMTVLQARYDYWFLYEGTPGGAFEANTDIVVRSDGTQTKASQEWSQALAPEQWVYVGDPTLGRSLFTAQHSADNETDSYAVGGANLMTVLGLGRSGAQAQIPLEDVPEEFTIGLIDEITHAAAAPLIRSAYKDLDTTAGEPEFFSGSGSLGNDNPVEVTITGNNVVTATFAPQAFELNLSVDGQGTVTKTPNKTTYAYNEEVTINATSSDPAWGFVAWEGDIAGLVDPSLSEQTVFMTADRNLTAKFLPLYTVETGTIGEGAVVADPQKDQYFSSEAVSLSAVPSPGWSFANWSGDADGVANPLVVDVTANKFITATFTQDEYTLVVGKTGNGTVDWEPKQATYLYGDVVDLTATPEEGSTFMGWSGTITSTEANHQIVITGNTTAIANFAEVSFRTLNITVNGQGTATKDPNKDQYQTGESVTLAATPANGWVFTGWTGDLISTENPDTIIISDSITVTANFALAGPFSLSVTQEGSGSVTVNPLKTDYTAGETVTLTPVAETGWVFANWKGDLSGSANQAIITMDEDKTITAVFIQPSATGPTSDNFDNCVLESQWTFVNPLGDGSYTVNGTQLQLSVPADTEHNVFESGNNGVRVMQETGDEDFSFDVKFSSPVVTDGTGQGLVIEQDAQNFIRYDIFRRNGKTTLFAARFENLVAIKTYSLDVAPAGPNVYLRAIRLGDTWQMNYSFDGVSWFDSFGFDHTLVVQKVGVFSSNFKVKNVIPAHTAVVEYFYNTADPNQPGDRSLLTVSVVGNGQVQRSVQAPYTCGQTVNLTAVPNTGGQFANWSGDATGTQNPLPLVLNTRKLVTATFTGGTDSFKAELPIIIRP